MKINNKLLLACALAITSNAYGMLTTTSFRIKKIRSFCTKTSSYDHPLIFKEGELNISTKKTTHDLLHEIIKLNNELLRTLLEQKDNAAGQLLELNGLHKELEQQYNIKIRPNE